MFEVTSAVPVPPARSKFPYSAMQIGESFFVPGKKPALMYTNNVRAGKIFGGKFIARAEGDGTRVWKVE